MWLIAELDILLIENIDFEPNIDCDRLTVIRLNLLLVKVYFQLKYKWDSQIWWLIWGCEFMFTNQFWDSGVLALLQKLRAHWLWNRLFNMYFTRNYDSTCSLQKLWPLGMPQFYDTHHTAELDIRWIRMFL